MPGRPVGQLHGQAPDARIRRPRMTPERERELLEAVLGVLRESGYEALSMDLVATRARCSKATLYRQWHSKAEMVVAAMIANRPVDPGAVDTGSLRGDLISLVEELSTTAEKDTALIAAIHHAALTDGDLAATLHASLADYELTHLSGLLDRAVARGELPGQPGAAEFLPQLLFGAVVIRPLIDGAFADSAYLARFVDLVVLPALRHS
ncbi:TetR family transcriptional regulator [Streptomyces sp. WAC 06738]|uniref:TetR/AcrR family transcriptional regulator n=1 Tax=Streptomyces sp. WAC 06738 TaxID=2203210 RepID=UPI000F7177CE|nr:TetR/AcrR family transcriptional regulator [Streptomyces sp. WAC 06738]AZM47007.1 TetR family transcriptional regulator [Streptomyces sp. WAC 06738]